MVVSYYISIFTINPPNTRSIPLKRSLNITKPVKLPPADSHHLTLPRQPPNNLPLPGLSVTIPPHHLLRGEATASADVITESGGADADAGFVSFDQFFCLVAFIYHDT